MRISIALLLLLAGAPLDDSAASTKTTTKSLGSLLKNSDVRQRLLVVDPELLKPAPLSDQALDRLLSKRRRSRKKRKSNSPQPIPMPQISIEERKANAFLLGFESTLPRPFVPKENRRGRFPEGLGGQQLGGQQLGGQQLGGQQLGGQQLGGQQLGGQQLGGQQLGGQQLGRQQLGRQQLGRQQLGRQQLGRQQLGRQQLGRQQLEGHSRNLLHYDRPPVYPGDLLYRGNPPQVENEGFPQQRETVEYAKGLEFGAAFAARRKKNRMRNDDNDLSVLLNPSEFLPAYRSAFKANFNAELGRHASQNHQLRGGKAESEGLEAGSRHGRAFGEAVKNGTLKDLNPNDLR